jgi:hypothetical protein
MIKTLNVEIVFMYVAKQPSAINTSKLLAHHHVRVYTIIFIL